MFAQEKDGSMLPIPIISLYAETHFKFFRLFPSLLYKKFPEIIFDLPRRAAPEQDLPVVLLINDIDRFPVDCLEVKITVSQKGRLPQLFQFHDIKRHMIDHPLAFQSEVYLFSIPRIALVTGLHYINCLAIVKKGKKSQTIINDNLTTSSKLPFSCFISNEPLPGSEFCSYGDLHVHSHFSQSHVEFGQPVQVIDLFAKSYGADFTGITDHSYDLSCSMKNFLLPDATLPRWRLLQKEFSREDLKNVIVPGEEISCLNSKGKAVHLCGFGLNEFIPGTIDGARKNNAGEPQLPIAQAASLLHKQEGVAFAAHPGSAMGFMQRLFLKRGTWSMDDLASGIDGLQAINNGFGISWNRAKALWINELLKGKKLSIIAGNDSHGDFNRYRYLSIPFIAVNEIFERHFCAAMTGTYEKVLKKRQLIEILKNGKTFVTNGPMLCISTSNSITESIIGNHKNDFKQEFITMILASNYEFGEPSCIKLYHGNYAEKKERLVFIKYFNNEGFTANIQVSLQFAESRNGYMRAEAECKKHDGALTHAATSPCYF